MSRSGRIPLSYSPEPTIRIVTKLKAVLLKKSLFSNLSITSIGVRLLVRASLAKASRMRRLYRPIIPIYQTHVQWCSTLPAESSTTHLLSMPTTKHLLCRPSSRMEMRVQNSNSTLMGLGSSMAKTWHSTCLKLQMRVHVLNLRQHM